MVLLRPICSILLMFPRFPRNSRPRLCNIRPNDAFQAYLRRVNRRLASEDKDTVEKVAEGVAEKGGRSLEPIRHNISHGLSWVEREEETRDTGPEIIPAGAPDLMSVT